LFGSLFLTSCGEDAGASKNDPNAPGVLVTVENDVITVDRYVEALQASQRYGPRQYRTIEAKEHFLRKVVDESVVAAHARKAGYAERPGVRKVVRDMIVQQYLADHLEPELEKIEVTEDEIQQFYEKSRSLYDVPRRVLPALIYVRRPKDRDPGIDGAARARAAKARQEALQLPKGSSNFGEVAKEYSDDSKSRINGGEIGWITDGDVPSWLEEQVSDTAFTLTEIGEVSDVIETERAFYIVKLVDQQASVTRSIGTVRDSIKMVIERRKREAIREKFFAELRGELNVKRSKSYKTMLEEIQPPKPGSKKAPSTPNGATKTGAGSNVNPAPKPSKETLDKVYDKFREVRG